MKAKVSRGAGFGGLMKYMFDADEHEHSLKDAEVVSTNMAGGTPDELTAEFAAVRRLRADIKKPVWHSSLSLPPGETLSPQRWDAVIRDYLVEMELDPDKHQYVAVIHRDTQHQHVHICVNRIGLDSKVWLGQWEAHRAIKATAKLEAKHVLRITKTLGLDQAKLDRALSDGEYQEAERTGKDPKRMQLAAIIREVRNRSKSFRKLVDGLATRGVTLSPNGLNGTVSGVSFKFKDTLYAGSKVAKDCAWLALSKQVGYDAERDADLVAALRAARVQDIEVVKDARALAREATTVEELTDAAIADLFGTRSVIPLTRFERTMSDLIEFTPAFAERVGDQVRSQLQLLGPGPDGQPVFTVDSVLERERRMIQGARLLAGDSHHDLTETEIAQAIYAKELEASKKQGRVVRMTDEQRAAVRHGFKGGFTVLQGSAGAGKSFAMECVRLGYEEKGYHVLGAAIARRAAQNLEHEAGIRSFTVAKLLTEIQGKRIELDRKTCIVVDEAGQVGSGYLSELVTLCEKAGAKLVFTGEDRQLNAIQHAGALRFLSRPEVIGTARIQAIQRQNEAWARQAVMDYRDGRMSEGLKAFEDRGLVRWERGGPEAAQEALIKAWRQFELANPGKESLILAHSNDSARALGAQVREIRKGEGRVSGPEYVLKAEHGGKGFDLTLAVGDRVRFGLNSEGDQGIGAINGTLGRLTAIRPVDLDGKPDYELTVLTDDRGEITFNASQYADEKRRVHLNQAYAMTVYSSQGVTVKGDVFVLQTPGMDRAHTYVSHSRAKYSSHTFVDADEYIRQAGGDDAQALRSALVQAMGRDAGERLATEVLYADDPGYVERTYGAAVDPAVRSARDLQMAAAEEEVEEELFERYDELRAAVDSDLYGMESVITMDRYEEAMLEWGEKYPKHAERLRQETAAELVELGKDEDGRALFSTTAIIDRERRMIRDVRTLAADRHHDLTDEQVDGAIKQLEEQTRIKTGRQARMTDEQRAGVKYALQAGGGYASLQGSAGAGKSFSMSAVRIAYEETGYRVVGAAVAKRAAQNLEDEAGIQSFTVAKLLKDLERGNLQLDHRTAVVIDEAGQVGAGYMAALAKECRAAGAKLVVTGEDKQLDAISHGGVLRFTSRDDVVGTARVEAIQRQREDWARQAVMDLRDGRVSEGLKAFEDHGLLHWVRGGMEATHERLISHWRRYEKANPEKSSLIVAHSNSSARALGERVRAIRRTEGKVVGPDHELRAIHGDKDYKLQLAQGDRIRFTMNSDQVGVINGTLGTILSITPETSEDGKPDYAFKVKTDDCGEVSFKLSGYADEKGRIHLNQAYTMTIYSSQGVTVDGNVFMLQTHGMDRAHTYVGASRAKDDTHFYIDRDAAVAMSRSDDPARLRERLVQNISRDSRKRLALEVIAANDAGFIEREFGPLQPDDGRLQRYAGIIEQDREVARVRERFAAEADGQRSDSAMTPDAMATRQRFELEARLDMPQNMRSSGMPSPRVVPRPF